MAEVTEGGNEKRSKSKQKKMAVRVDFTPMVDMNMLLITFFMLCTTMSKPQTMEISMPAKEDLTDDQKTKVKASEAVTLLLAGDDRIFYYDGQPNYEDYTSLKQTSYDADGLRAMLLQRNAAAVNQVRKLEKVSEIKGGKNTPTVIIKATDDASYKNLIDALDEMQICNIGKYVITDITEGDEFLIKNFDAKGNLPVEGAAQ